MSRPSPVAGTARALTALTALSALAALGPPAGCTSPPDVELEVVPSAIVPTVVDVRWPCQLDQANDRHVVFALDQGREHRATARVDDDGQCAAQLLGLKADRRYEAWAVESAGGEVWSSPPVQVDTGAPPPGLPAMRVEDADDGVAPSGGYLITSLLTDPSIAVILDGDGDLVWWHRPADLWDQLFISRVLPARDGRSLLYLAGTSFDGDTTDDAGGTWRLLRVGFDGTELGQIDVGAVHHDFVELPDGSLLVLQNDPRGVIDRQVVGDRVLQVDWDGGENEIWSSWDELDYDPDLDEGGPGGDHWTHANAIDYDEADDAILVSLCNVDSIVKVDLGSGELRWVFGGRHNDLELPQEQRPPFNRQHNFEWLGDGIVVFDNGEPERQRSRVREFTVDEDAGAAELRWEHDTDPPTFTLAFGDVQRLPGGRTMITWGSSGKIDEVDADGRRLWHLAAGLGAGFGYATWLPTLGE